MKMPRSLGPSASLPRGLADAVGRRARWLAQAEERFGVPAVIVMPTTAPAVKVDGVRSYGAEADLLRALAHYVVERDR